MAIKNNNELIEILPHGRFISYQVFCNSYYKLAETLLILCKKALKEGLLSLEDELENYPEGFIKKGLRLITDGTDNELVKHILTLSMEHENNYYRKKLMQIAKEGILFLQEVGDPIKLAILLASLVNIRDNPLEAACTKYFAGNIDAFSNVDLKAAIQTDNDIEEVEFIGRAITLRTIAHKQGILAWEEYIDSNAISKRDVLEYGVRMIIDGWEFCDIDKILNSLIEHETNPVQKNFALAKKEAVSLLYNGHGRIMIATVLGAYFEEYVLNEVKKKFSDILE